MKDHLLFDVTDANTIADSDSVGAFVRGSGGAVIESKVINSSDWLQVASALFDGSGNALTSTTGSLNVNVSNAIAVDVVHTSDSVALGDGTNLLTSTTVGGDIGLDVNIINASIAVTATNLDIRDLVYTQDSITAYQGTDPWVVGDGGNSLTVDATNLDIRDLAAATDSVSAWVKDGSGNSINSTSNALNVYLTNSLTVNDAALANTALAAINKSCTTSASVVVASPLSARKYLDVYNNGNQKIFLGGSGVTTTTGFPVSPGSYLELRAGAAQSLYMIAANGTQDVRTLELS
jgi:hypothetical protein